MLIKYFGVDMSAIATVVTVAEILKNNGLAVEKSNDFHSFYMSVLIGGFSPFSFYTSDCID